jgi:hypothetical protein
LATKSTKQGLTPAAFLYAENPQLLLGFKALNIVLTEIISFIEGEIRSLKDFNTIFKLEEYKLKLTGQSTTSK